MTNNSISMGTESVGSHQSSAADFNYGGDDSDDDNDYTHLPGAVQTLRAQGPALTATSLGGPMESLLKTRKKSALKSRTSGMKPKLDNFNHYFGDMLGKDCGSMEGTSLPPLDDAVVERSKAFLKGDNRMHSAMSARTPGRPQTQGGAPRQSKLRFM